MAVKTRGLTAARLREALRAVDGCASVLVVGSDAKPVGQRILGGEVGKGEFDGLKLHEDRNRDPDGWELF